MATAVKMPQLGESVVEGEIGKWLVQEGDRVSKDQPVVEIMTDKADSEVPSPEEGVVTKIVAGEGDTVSVGDVLCEIDASGEAAEQAPEKKQKAGDQSEKGGGKAATEGKQEAKGKEARPAEPEAAAKKEKKREPARQARGEGESKAKREGDGRAKQEGGRQEASTPTKAPASPAVRKLAREHSVEVDDLAGSGEGGRVTKQDVIRAAERQEQPSKPTPRAPRAEVPQGGALPTSYKGNFKPEPYHEKPSDKIVPFSRRRRIIADHMVYSKLTAPHVMTVAECDLNRTAKLRDANKAKLKKEGVNLTYMAFVCAATCRALREYPIMNSRVLDDAYAMLGEIHLGIAVETEQGLIVPVIRHADELTVRGVARGIDELADKAREGKLSPDDLAGKTFTVSNPGRKGNLFGAAIISQPNVGILRVGEIKKTPVVIEQDGEDLIGIHPVMHLVLSYDHRVVDGVEANAFLYRLSEILEQGDFTI